MQCAAAGLFALALPAHALDPQRPLTEYALDTWSVQDGLPHSLVLDVEQASDGYLWLGTWLGAARFNGRTFTVFDRNNVAALRGEGVIAVLPRRDGSLWLMTYRGGIAIRDARGWRRFGVEQGLPSHSTIDAIEDRRGRVWIGMERDGVAMIDGETVRVIGPDHGVPRGGVLALADDAEGRVWIGTGGGLARIDGDRLERFGPAEGVPDGEVGAVVVLKNGDVYIGSKLGSLRFDGARFVRDPPELQRGEITTLLEDRNGCLWVGTIAHGVARLCAGHVEFLGTAQGLPNDQIDSLAEDGEGSLWIGSHGGLARLRDTPYARYTKTKGLANDFVRATLEDTDGSMWVGTNHGLSQVRDGTIRNYHESDGLSGEAILSLMQHSDGRLWIGTYSRGIDIRESDGRFTVLRRTDGLAGDEIRAMAEAPDGTVWVGTANGVTHLDGPRTRSWTTADGLPRDFVRALSVDPDGSVWVGSGYGLSRIVDGRLEVQQGFTDAGGSDAFAIRNGDAGSKWITTVGGLVRWKNGRFVLLGAAHGVPDATYFDLVRDRAGGCWASGPRGVFTTSCTDLEAVADGRLAKLTGRVVGATDSADPIDANGGSQPPAWAARDGRLWFATGSGVVVLEPDSVAVADTRPPPVVIERATVDGRPIDLADVVTLPAGTRRFELEYTGLSFLDPERLRYRYRLDGFDPDWIEAGATRAVGYTNLAPGRYRFAVATARPDGDYGDAPAQLLLELEPHFWQTLPFRLALAALGVGLIVLAYKARVARLKRNARALEQLVEVRTHDLSMKTAELEVADREKGELIVRLREQSEMNERLAREDPLTGLPNRRHFDRACAAAFRACRDEGRPIAVALIDVDHFKRVNDEHSHAAGDTVLRTLGELIRVHCVAPVECGRFGGEEFTLLFPGHDARHAARACETLRTALETRTFRDGHDDFRVTLSAGVSDDPAAEDHERLLADADAKLYEAKRGGRNRVCS